jgi:hypothetical protein
MTPETPITVGHVGWSPDYKGTPPLPQLKDLRPSAAMLRKWLIERLRARDLGEQESYSVGVCQKCSYRTLWSGGMEGERFHVCAPCKAQQLHNFYSFDLGER